MGSTVETNAPRSAASLPAGTAPPALKEAAKADMVRTASAQSLAPQHPLGLTSLESSTKPESDLRWVVPEIRRLYSAEPLDLPEPKRQALMAPFPDHQVEIRPTGELYIPHVYVRRRLNEVLGPGRWALWTIRHGRSGNVVYVHCVLIVEGRAIGDAYADATWEASNPRMSFTDAVQAAEASALRRLAAKFLSCGDQVWLPDFCRRWIAQYAESQSVWEHGRRVERWRRRDSGITVDEGGRVETAAEPPKKGKAEAEEAKDQEAETDEVATISQKQIRYISSLLRQIAGPDETRHRSLLGHLTGKTSRAQLTAKQASKLIDDLQTASKNKLVWNGSGFVAAPETTVGAAKSDEDEAPF